MSKREDNIKALLKELKEEQQRISEKQLIINKSIAEQNKKNKKSNLFVLFLCLFVSGISSVLSYSIGASSVEYTAKDSNWHVENTQQAIDDLYNSLGSALVGSVYSYMGVTAPFGYLVCNGATYNIEDYPRLANHINRNFGKYNYFGGDGETTFAVPDLRGEFLRGSGSNGHSGEGAGAAVGAHQNATRHLKIYRDQNISMIGNTTTAYQEQNADAFFNSIAGGSRYTGTTGYNGSGTTSIFYSARPTNTSVLFIIKY